MVGATLNLVSVELTMDSLQKLNLWEKEVWTQSCDHFARRFWSEP